jgi:nickel transport system substrate-binding protein
MMKRRSFLKALGAAAPLSFVPGVLSRAFAATDDTIRFAIAKPAGDLNPHVYKGLWGVQDLIFEPLIAYGPEGALQPALASAWEVSADGKALALTLREGVTFQDGAPWNAAAMQ